MTKFKDLSNEEQTALIGQITKMFDYDMPIQKIAEDLDMSVKTVLDILRIVLDVREKIKEIE